MNEDTFRCSQPVLLNSAGKEQTLLRTGFSRLASTSLGVRTKWHLITLHTECMHGVQAYHFLLTNKRLLWRLLQTSTVTFFGTFSLQLVLSEDFNQQNHHQKCQGCMAGCTCRYFRSSWEYFYTCHICPQTFDRAACHLQNWPQTETCLYSTGLLHCVERKSVAFFASLSLCFYTFLFECCLYHHGIRANWQLASLSKIPLLSPMMWRSFWWLL